MARSGKNGTSEPRKPDPVVKASDVPWGGYVDLRLDEDDKQQFAVWSEAEQQSFWLDFVELLGKGFKFGLSYDQSGDFYLTSFTAFGKELIGLQDRWCLTARAPDWETAVALLLFKHLVLAQENWGNFRPKTQRFDNFG